MLSAVASISLTRAVSSANCTIVCLNVCDSELWADCIKARCNIFETARFSGGRCDVVVKVKVENGRTLAKNFSHVI